MGPGVLHVVEKGFLFLQSYVTRCMTRAVPLSAPEGDVVTLQEWRKGCAELAVSQDLSPRGGDETAGL